MDYRKLIEKDIRNTTIDMGSLEMERNDFQLELNEGQPERWYATAKDGSFEMILNAEKVIETIFLYPDKDGNFPIDEYSTKDGRKKILQKMGSPDKEGEPFENSILGFSGGFDRFDKEISYHFEYQNKEQTKLKKITLMKIAIAP